MKKRIIILSNSCWNLYNFRKPLIKSLKEQNLEVFCICKKDEYALQLEGICDRLFTLDLNATSKSIFKDFYYIIRLFLLLIRLRPKAVLSFTVKMNIYSGLLCRFLSIPHLPTISGLGSTYVSSNIYLRRGITFLHRISLRHSKTIFFHNETDLRTFRYFRIGHLKNYQLVAGSGVDIETFKPALREARFRNDSLQLYFIGRLIKDKGIIEYLEAAKMLSATHPNIRFNIVGKIDNDSPSAISKKFLDNYSDHNICYHGPTEDVTRYLTYADFVVLPSYREGLSKLLLESSAMAIPMIASKVPGCREVVIDNTTGFLCKQKNVQDLARVIVVASKASRDQKIKLGERARDLAIKQFSSQAVAKIYIAKVES